MVDMQLMGFELLLGDRDASLRRLELCRQMCPIFLSDGELMLVAVILAGVHALGFEHVATLMQDAGQAVEQRCEAAGRIADVVAAEFHRQRRRAAEAGGVALDLRNEVGGRRGRIEHGGQ